MASPKSNKKTVVKKAAVKKSIKRGASTKFAPSIPVEMQNLSTAELRALPGDKFAVSKTIPATATNGVGVAYDNINPNHYKNASIETIDMMIRIWGKESTALHCEMTAFKYRSRIGTKPGQSIKDELSKIEWYENKALELRGLPLKTLIKS